MHFRFETTGLKTAEEYVKSLRALKVNAYIGGEKVEHPIDHPMVAPHVNAVAKTYELANMPEHQDTMTAISHITGERVHRHCHISLNNEDLVKKL